MHGLSIIRDDLIPGGTKARVLPTVLDSINAPRTLTYASPVYGYAQIALAHAARATGRHAVIYVAQRRQIHPRTAEAARAGAQIVQVPYGYLSNTTSKAAAHAASTDGLHIPFGIDLPSMRTALQDLAGYIPAPAQAWTVAGSGTLTRALQAIWTGTQFYAVRVGSEPNAGRAHIYTAPEPFERDARKPPPFPSCSNYDAKAWQFLRQHAQPGALFWNVAA
jgi:hypothetical protein